jgi:hypothetical protein
MQRECGGGTQQKKFHPVPFQDVEHQGEVEILNRQWNYQSGRQRVTPAVFFELAQSLLAFSKAMPTT